MRLFIAVKFSSEIENTLIKAQNDIRSHGVTGNYTNCSNLHLTLAFIGEYDSPDKVLNAMKLISFKAFLLSLSGKAGAFGDLWWAGLDKSSQLFSLDSQLRKALSDNGIPFDKKPFKPHITLLRRAELPYGKDFDIKACKLPKASMKVDKLSLMLSHRENGRLIYTELGYVSAADEMRKGDV